MKNKFNMGGRTMFETIAAMAIISMIAASIYKLANSVTDRYKMSRIQTQIYTLQKTINDRFMAEGNYDTVNSLRHENKHMGDVLIDENLIDGELVKAKHVFDGIVNMGGFKISGDGSGEASRYFIMFGPGNTGKNVWTEVCMSLGDMNWLHEGGSSLVSQCFGEKCNIGKGVGLIEKIPDGCKCTQKIPADETILENCDDKAYILWIFE